MINKDKQGSAKISKDKQGLTRINNKKNKDN